jgi:poly(A) polymerase
MWLLWEVGAMAVLLPELSAFLDDDEATGNGSERFFRKMDVIDRKTRDEGVLDDVVLMTALLYEPLEEAIHGARDIMDAVSDFLEPIIERVAMPRRIADAVRRIMTMVPRILQGRIGRAAKSELYLLALDVAEIVLASRGQSTHAIIALRREAMPTSSSPSARPARDPRRFDAMPRSRGARH